MSFGLRLTLLLWIAGCAEPLMVVPDSDWRTVPPAQRDALDKQHDADLAAARAELAAASASLAAFQKAPATGHAASNIKVDPSDAWARDHERARADALARVDAAVAEVQRTDLALRRLRVDAASARIDVVVSQREVTRAQAIDHSLPGTDHYDIAPLRGQFSHIQQHWYAVSSSANAAREAFARANASLASTKVAYAQVMRGGPAPQPEAAVAADEHARLELTGWAVTRSDIRRRRGLRRFLDDAGATPQLRKVAFQLSPAVRARPSPAPSPPAPPSPAPPGASDARGNAPPAPGRPADRPGNPSSPAALANTKSAAPPPRGPAPGAGDHPADRAGDPSPPATALSSTAKRPPEAPRPAPLPAPKTEHTGSAAPAPTPAMSAGSKSAEPPRGTAPAKPAPQAPAAEHAASPEVAAPSAPLAGKPAAPRP